MIGPEQERLETTLFEGVNKLSNIKFFRFGCKKASEEAVCAEINSAMRQLQMGTAEKTADFPCAGEAVEISRLLAEI